VSACARVAGHRAQRYGSPSVNAPSSQDVRIVGHMGMGRWRAGSRYAENSIPAFQAALRAGADGVELDIHLAADDALIVHHDYRLGRASEGNRIRNTQLVCDLPSQELRRVPLKGEVAARIPTLDEVVNGVTTDLGERELWVELKRQHHHDRNRRLVERAVETLAHNPVWPRVVLRSFDTDMLVHALSLRGDARVHELTVTRIEHAIRRGRRRGFEGIAIYHPFARSALCRQAKRAGLTVTAGGDPPPGEVERLLRRAVFGGDIDHITVDDVDHALATRRDLQATAAMGP
jgi:glycerophosphoryl diester phosphodiesterase